MHSGPDISLSAAASLAGLSREQTRPALAELARAHLVAERIPGRFALHDLLRAYATEVAYTYDSATYRLAARERMLDHYLYTACRANELINPPSATPFTLPASGPEVTPENPADQKQALAWFESEHAVLLTVLRQATGSGPQIWQLAWALASYFEYQGHWRDWRESQTIALDAARRLSDQLAQAHSHRLLSSVAIHLSAYEEARAHLRSALGLFAELDDAIGQAGVHHNLAWMLGRQGRYREALPHVQQALTLSQAADHRSGQARALNAVGWFRAQLGEYEQALACCQQALDLQHQIGDLFDEAMTYDSLGYIHRHLGHQQQATACYGEAIRLYGQLGDLYNEADSLASLGDSHLTFGDLESAGPAWQRSLAILEQLGHPDAGLVRARIRENTISSQ
jgi:tetratricopeptide (TPR) repeat protein